MRARADRAANGSVLRHLFSGGPIRRPIAENAIGFRSARVLGSARGFRSATERAGS
jgi:hypothetical protein